MDPKHCLFVQFGPILAAVSVSVFVAVVVVVDVVVVVVVVVDVVVVVVPVIFSNFYLSKCTDYSSLFLFALSPCFLILKL